MAKNICGIMIGKKEGSAEAKKVAETMKDCPNVVVSGTTSNIIYLVCMVPEEKKWWLKYPETDPNGAGLGKAHVYIVENISYSEKSNLKIPAKKAEIAPCGSDCQTCPLRKEYNCIGCPATVHYRGK